jgi:truncated hemoglobin YjbI
MRLETSLTLTQRLQEKDPETPIFPDKVSENEKEQRAFEIIYGKVHLTKAERKGNSLEEVHAPRKAKYEEIHHG